MTDHQLAAYRALFEMGESLRAILANAGSKLHPLKLDTNTVLHIDDAMQSLFAAQRAMEPSR